MIIKQMITVVVVSVFAVGLSGCTSPVKQKNVTEKVVMQKEEKVSDKYREQVSVITGRLDGMNRAVVQGLTETLDTSRLAREMAEEALAIARENQKLLKTLQEEMNSAEGGGDAGNAEEFDGGGDF